MREKVTTCLLALPLRFLLRLWLQMGGGGGGGGAYLWDTMVYDLSSAVIAF